MEEEGKGGGGVVDSMGVLEVGWMGGVIGVTLLYGDGSADAAGHVYAFKYWFVDDTVVSERTAARGVVDATSSPRPYPPHHPFCPNPKK
jgi:hypothetical protein